jgi:hypothetical protein
LVKALRGEETDGTEMIIRGGRCGRLAGHHQATCGGTYEGGADRPDRT